MFSVDKRSNKIQKLFVYSGACWCGIVLLWFLLMGIFLDGLFIHKSLGAETLIVIFKTARVLEYVANAGVLIMLGFLCYGAILLINQEYRKTRSPESKRED